MAQKMTDLQKTAEGLRKHAEKHAGEMLSTIGEFHTACMKEVQQMKAYLDRLEEELEIQKNEVEKLKRFVKEKQEIIDYLTDK